MLQNLDLSAVSDGRLYTAEDLARTDCGGCIGCSRCCSGMAETIVLDPYDIYQLCLAGTAGRTFPELLAAGAVSLQITDGLILPLLSMRSGQDACTFLDGAGRCSIHDHRPGICRLFPMARIYEEDSDRFHYFLQIHECPSAKSKIRVSKWIGVPQFRDYERFISAWHHILVESRRKAGNAPETIKAVSMDLLSRYYLTPYETGTDFYEQFYKR